jgi:hypothetical protein
MRTGGQELYRLCESIYLDGSWEEAFLIHSMQVPNLPSLLGESQRRLVSIVGGEGTLSNLAPDREMMSKMGCKGDESEVAKVT